MNAMYPTGTPAPKKILIFRYGQLGDTLVSVPCLWAIRYAFPDARLTLLSEIPGAGHISPDAILPPSGLIDTYWKYESPASNKFSLNIFRLAGRIRSQKFNLLLYLAPHARNGGWRLHRDLLFFRLAGLSRILGHLGATPIPKNVDGRLPPVKSEAESLLDRLEHAGFQFDRTNMRADIAPTCTEIEKADTWFSSATPRNVSRKQCVAVGIGGKWPSKIWPHEYFEELGIRLIQELNLFPVIFGGPEDVHPGKNLLKTWGTGVISAGVLSVRESAAAMNGMKMYVGNDSGAMHLAASAGLICVGIFSSQDWPGRWRPFGNHHVELRHRIECEGCRREICTKKKSCLQQITPAVVFDACRQIYSHVEE